MQVKDDAAITCEKDQAPGYKSFGLHRHPVLFARFLRMPVHFLLPSVALSHFRHATAFADAA